MIHILEESEDIAIPTDLYLTDEPLELSDDSAQRTVNTFDSTPEGTLELIQHIFEPDGDLSQLIKNYEHREVQIKVVKQISEAVKSSRHIMVEAGTGSGKSLSGLIPTILLKPSKWRIVVATASNALLDQYINKDLPLIQEILRPYVPFTFAMAKGRNNFICKDKLDQWLSNIGLGFDSKIERKIQESFLKWIHETKTGDKGELTFAIPYELWNDVNCEDVCKKNGCAYYKADKCFFQNARENYQNADVVVTNYTMLLLDKQIGGYLLGPYQLGVFDEGHTMIEIAQQTLGTEITNRTVSGFFTYVKSKLMKMKIWPQDIDADALTNKIGECEERMWYPFTLLPKHITTERIDNIDPHVWKKAKEGAEQLAIAVGEIARVVSRSQQTDGFDRVTMGDFIEGMRAKVTERMGDLYKLFEIHPGVADDPSSLIEEDNWCKYIEIDRKNEKYMRMSIHRRPVDVAPLLRKYFWEQCKYLDGEVPIQESETAMSDEFLHTVIVMSATLATGKSFRFQKMELGLYNPMEIIVGSPFDFKKQMFGYFPRDIPDKKDENMTDEKYWDAIATKLVLPAVTAANGRTFVLFTSYKDMEAVYAKVKRRIPHRVFIQGEMSRQAIVDAFKKDVHSCAFVTKSFWTGVDIPGEALSCIVIPKLPFRVPTEPMFAAKCDLIQKKGGNPFMDYMLPVAIADLRQGVGRLIRTRTDKGLLVFGDARVFTKRYGGIILNSLPPMSVLDTLPNKCVI